jgi:hypothetical protein
MMPLGLSATQGAAVEIPADADGSDVAAMVEWCREHAGDLGESWTLWDSAFVFRDAGRAREFRRFAAHRALAQRLARTIRRVALTASPGWSALLLVPSRFFDHEHQEGFEIGLCPCQATEPLELVKIHFDREKGFSLPKEFIALVREVLGPFIVGVGEVRADRTPEGIVLVRTNDGDFVYISHGSAPRSVGTA